MTARRTRSLRSRLARVSIALLLLAAGEAAQAAMESVQGLGALDFPTSTKSAAAQTEFVRGMLLLHVYEYPRAEKAFQQAEKLDPDFVMAYWGEAMTATHPIWNQDNAAAGRAALAKLGATPEARAAKATTPREKAWLGAVEALFGPGTLAERDKGFLTAMEAIAKRWPEDDEAQLFLAQALLGVTRGDRNTDNYLRAAEICKRVLARNPQHPGAAHYWIHGMDDPEHAAGALPAARVLAKIAPDAGHAQHMVSHIFVSLGMWDDVVEANEHSVALTDVQSRAANKPTIGCGHYAEWLQYGYYEQGRRHDAGKLLDTCLRDAPAALAWMEAHPGEQVQMAKTPDALKRYLDLARVAMRGTMLVETATAKMPASAAKASSPVAKTPTSSTNTSTSPAATPTPQPLADADGAGRALGMDAFAVGYAAAVAGDLAATRAQLQRVREFAAQPAPKTEFQRHVTEYLGIAGDMLEAMIEQGAGKHESAQALAARAAKNNDALPVEFGPPPIFKPPHELAGELLLAAKQPQAALAQFDLSLKTAPNRTASLLGRARALKASGNSAEAARTYAQLATIWKNADADLPALAEVRGGAKAAVVAESKP